MAIFPIIVHFITLQRAHAWRGMWICVRSKDAQKQLAQTFLKLLVLRQARRKLGGLGGLF